MNFGKGSGSRISCGKFNKWLSPAAAAPREEQRKRHSDCQGYFRFDYTNYNWKIPDVRIAPIGDQSFLSTWSAVPNQLTQRGESCWCNWLVQLRIFSVPPPCSAQVCPHWKFSSVFGESRRGWCKCRLEMWKIVKIKWQVLNVFTTSASTLPVWGVCSWLHIIQNRTRRRRTDCNGDYVTSNYMRHVCCFTGSKSCKKKEENRMTAWCRVDSSSEREDYVYGILIAA